MWTRLLLFLIFALLSACRLSAQDAVGAMCGTAQDCYFSELVCNTRTGTCQPPLAEGEFGCADEADCRAGLVCEVVQSGGVCQSTLGAGEGPCTAGGCEAGLTCATTTEGSVCLASLGEPCASADDCPDPAVCAPSTRGAASECLAPAAAGEACGADDGCTSGLCEDGQCVLAGGEVCDAEGTCTAGLVCRPDEAGVDRCATPGSLLDACAEDADCDDDTECAEGRCMGSAGTACASDALCAEPWVCRPDASGEDVCAETGGPGDACDSSGDCAQGDCSLSTGTCPASEGGTCESESDCLDGLRCAVGFGDGRTCQEAVAGCGACDSTDDCADGAWCSAGYCEQVLDGTCDTNACCPDGSTCRSADGVSPSACLLPEDTPGAFCLDDGACADWLTCHENECLVPEGGECATAGECAGADLTCMLHECASRSGVGGVCVDEDGDGPWDDACDPGLLCGASYTCIAPLSVDEGGACNRDVECQAGLSCNSNLCAY